jgi:hypothetical protein
MSHPPVLRLMPDYMAGTALWAPGSETYPVDPATLPIPPGLAVRITDWARAWDATFCPSDPMASGFASESDRLAFRAEGVALREALASALPGIAVELKL